MYRIRKINILSLAITVTSIYFVLGIIFGILIALLKTNPTYVNIFGQDLLQDLSKLSYWQIILLYPIAYAVGGFVLSISVGIIYNIVAGTTGGVAVSLVKDSTESFEKDKKSKR